MRAELRTGHKGSGFGLVRNGGVSVVLAAMAVFLGWQVAKAMATDRLPPEMAVRMSPSSAAALSRAAESELEAGRFDNAEYLASRSLARAPFDARALRVVGLTKDKAGDTALADDLLTLAGNWSLRDDPAHAWLFEHRLKLGQYSSAFAHADTLARRRRDIWPNLFELFAVAGTEDPHALPVLVLLVAETPPWRQAFLNGLIDAPTERNQRLLVALAVNLQRTKAPLTRDELVQVYAALLRTGQAGLVKLVRTQTGRPAATATVINGGFEPPSNPAPFEWTLGPAVGIVPEIMPDPVRKGDSALRVEYDGFSTGVVASQLLQLAPGQYRLTVEARADAGAVNERLRWVLGCYGNSQALAQMRPDLSKVGAEWKPISFAFDIPDQGCELQSLVLQATPENHHSTVIAWYGRLSISRIR